MPAWTTSGDRADRMRSRPKANIALTSPRKTESSTSRRTSHRRGVAMSSSETTSVTIASMGRSASTLRSKHLVGEQRQVVEHQGCDRDDDHVGEVADHRVEQISVDVRESSAPFLDAVDDHTEVVLEKHQVGGALGGVRAAGQGDAYVGGLQRRRVVDAIARGRHVAAEPLQRLDQVELVGRARPPRRSGRAAPPPRHRCREARSPTRSRRPARRFRSGGRARLRAIAHRRSRS